MADEATTTEVIEEKADFSKIMGRANIKFAEGKDVFDAYAAIVPDVCGGTEAEFRSAFAMFRQKAERDVSIKSIEKDLTSYKVPVSIVKKLAKGNDHITKFTVAPIKDAEGKVTTPGYTPKLTYVVEFIPGTEEKKNDDGEVIAPAKADSAKLKLIVGKVSTRSTGSGTKKGRISMLNAWKFGKKKGDKFKLEACDGGTKYYAEGDTLGRFVKKGELTGYLKRVEGDSETIKHAASYDGMKSLH